MIPLKAKLKAKLKAQRFQVSKLFTFISWNNFQLICYQFYRLLHLSILYLH